MLIGYRRLQQTMRLLHLWLGLVAGLFIVMMSVTGMIIVFRSEIEESVAPKASKLQPGPSPSLATIEKSLKALRPGSRIARVTFPNSVVSTLLVETEGADKKKALLLYDPSTGRALGERQTLAWLDWIVSLHQNLLSGKTGRAWTGWIGVALFLLGASGVVSWLTGPRDWKRSLSVPQKGPWKRVNYQGHKWAGLWASVFLLVVSSTGMVLAWPDSTQQAIRAVTGEPVPAKIVKSAEVRGPKVMLPLDAYVRAAETSLPGGVVREMRLAGRNSGGVSVTVSLPGDFRSKGGNIVILDPATAAVVSVDLAAARPFSKQFVDLGNMIHKTEAGGLPVRVAWALLGLTPTLLFVSGVGIWWQRRRVAVRRPVPARVPQIERDEALV